MAEHQISIEEAEANLLACAAFVAENIKSSDGHAEAMKEIVPRYLEKSSVDLAAELANSVDDPFTRDRLLSRVAEKCAAIGDDEYAFQLVEAIEDSSTQAQAREHIAVQKTAEGDYEKAFQIAETLPHADFVLAEIATRQASDGDEAAALKTLETIDFPSAKASAFQNVALQNLEKGDLAKAVQMLEKAVESAEEIEFTEEKIRALTEIGNHFIEANDNGKAIETFDLAKTSAETLDNVHRESFLSAIALGFLQAGSLDLADRTLDLIVDKTQIASTLLGFAREFWRKGERDEATETLEEAYAILKSQRDSEIRDSRARFGLWSTIAVEFARIERAERAIEIAQEIIDENSQTSALANIAQVCTLQNKDELARQAVNSIGDDAQKMFALIGISDAKNKLEKKDEALNYLREAETLCETVPQLASRSTAFNELAGRFYNYGDAEKSRSLLHENLETIANIRDESSRAVALAQLSDFYEQLKFDLNDGEKGILLGIIRKSEI
jgi:tetratricopeptide (TPR) repeat protein